MKPKIVNDWDLAHNLAVNFRSMSKVVVLVSGDFDIIHAGYIEFFTLAKGLGDVLIVAIGTDERFKQFRDSRGPINSLTERTSVLEGITPVDLIVPFAQESASGLLQYINPTIYAIEEHRATGETPEEIMMKELGGTIRILPSSSTISELLIVERIIKRESQKKEIDSLV